MSWAEICNDPVLKDLPFKIQTDKWGHIVMSPATNEHGMYQAKIVALLSRLLATGTVISECSVQTHEGVKVADVAWASDDFMRRNRGTTPFQEAPELCVEILSPSNTLTEMDEKKNYISPVALENFGFAINMGTCCSTKIRAHSTVASLSAHSLT